MFRTLALASLLTAGFVHAAPTAPGVSARRPFDDAKYDEALDAAALDAGKKGSLFRAGDLAIADRRTHIPYSAQKPSEEKPGSGEFFRRAQKATLVLVAATKKDLAELKKEARSARPETAPAEKTATRRDIAPRGGKIHRTSVGTATAFVIDSANGIIVTCRHVLEFDREAFVLVAVTAEGRAIEVKEILLGDKAHDLAFLKIDATDLPALPVARDVEAGEHIRIMAHPSGYYYHMTEGIVARHSRVEPEEEELAGQLTTSVDITADIAEGSSGGAVLDDRGAVVGVAQEYSLAENDDHQTAFKHRGAIPSREILRHLKPEEAPAK